MTGALEVARYTLQENLRRRVFVVVLVLSVAFLGLYWWGTSAAFREIRRQMRLEDDPTRFFTIAGGTLLGIAMFAILFLGTVLAVFLTLNAVRGDADRGVLQGILVRPVTRAGVIAGRFLAAFAVCGTYVTGMFLLAALIVRQSGDWTPDRWLTPVLGLIGAVAVMIAFALLGSVFFASTANGIAVFMVFGAGLVGGLLGQIGRALASETLSNIGTRMSRALPFEALYQHALYGLTADSTGLEREVIVNLGPFGGARAAGPLTLAWAVAYIVGLLVLAGWAFRRRDL